MQWGVTQGEMVWRFWFWSEAYSLQGPLLRKEYKSTHIMVNTKMII